MVKLTEARIPALSALGSSCTQCGNCGGPAISIAEMLVCTGQRVEKDEPLVMLETSKAIVEVHSPCAGQVQALLVAQDEPVEAGQVFLLLSPA